MGHVDSTLGEPAVKARPSSLPRNHRDLGRTVRATIGDRLEGKVKGE